MLKSFLEFEMYIAPLSKLNSIRNNLQSYALPLILRLLNRPGESLRACHCRKSIKSQPYIRHIRPISIRAFICAIMTRRKCWVQDFLGPSARIGEAQKSDLIDQILSQTLNFKYDFPNHNRARSSIKTLPMVLAYKQCLSTLQPMHWHSFASMGGAGMNFVASQVKLAPILLQTAPPTSKLATPKSYAPFLALQNRRLLDVPVEAVVMHL